MTHDPYALRPLPGQEALSELLTPGPEVRRIALGKHYYMNNLDEPELVKVGSEIQKARMLESHTVLNHMRRSEIDELRLWLAREPQVIMEDSNKRRSDAAMLRSRALAALQLEAQAMQHMSQEQLALDRKRIIDRERDRLLERRREFEQQHGVSAERLAPSPSTVHANGGGGNNKTQLSQSITRHGLSSALSGNDFGNVTATLPLLVMNVALGNGKEDKIVVYSGDNPEIIAANFVAKNKLPERTKASLTGQSEANMIQAQARRTSSQTAY